MKRAIKILSEMRSGYAGMAQAARDESVKHHEHGRRQLGESFGTAAYMNEQQVATLERAIKALMDEDGPERHGLYMIHPHPEAGYPPCGVCGEDARWELLGLWCSKHFAEEAECQAEARDRALAEQWLAAP